MSDVSFSQAVFDRSDELLRLTLDGEDNYRLPVVLKDVSPIFLESTLLYEDRYFYQHFGVNFIALFRAAWSTYVIRSRVVGASTITMQLARQLYRIDSRSIAGKSEQILKAVMLEFLYSKKEILEAYLNVAPYGYNILGVEAASRIYFNKPSRRLSLMEAITLAVIPQNPNKRVRGVSVGGQAKGELQEARGRLFHIWQERHPNNVELDSVSKLSLKMRSPRALPFLAPHFTQKILRENRSQSIIRTTLDLSLQRTVEKITRSYILQKNGVGIENAVAMVVDSETMQVLSYLGSSDFFNDGISGQVDGVRARRSPGSALKPFVYGLALEQGLINPITVLKDAPSGYFGSYTPDNFDGEFAGPISATDALIHSRNVPAIRLAKEVKEPTLYQFLKTAEIPLNSNPEHYGLSIVLGTAEVTMEELVSLYSVMNNDGKKYDIVSTFNESRGEGVKLLTTEANFLLRTMLSHNPAPDVKGVEQIVDKLDVSWKTGTSHGFRDAWSVGVFGRYVLAVWIGNFSGQGNPEFVGRAAAGPLFFRIIESMKALGMKGLRSSGAPDSTLKLNEVEVCSVSGQLAHRHCRHRRVTWFIPGRSSIKKCSIHREIDVIDESGARACPEISAQSHKEVFEFWPSDLLALFKRAGVGRRTPPAFDSRCLKLAPFGQEPEILSPKLGVVYTLRSRGTGTHSVPLVASVDGDVESMSWYVDGRFQGEYLANEIPTWIARAGRHEIQVIDDRGRSSAMTVNVEQVD